MIHEFYYDDLPQWINTKDIAAVMCSNYVDCGDTIGLVSIHIYLRENSNVITIPMLKREKACVLVGELLKGKKI